MAIITRYKFKNFYQTAIPQTAGLVEDGGFSTYTLDTPQTPGGTSDFLGVIQNVHLLGLLDKVTVDTKRRNPNEIDTMTPEQFRQTLERGEMVKTVNEIGWVVINKSRASFYYKDCKLTPTGSGKQPHSEHYFDIDNFYIDNFRLVTGPDGPQGRTNVGLPALEQLAPIDPNIENNLGLIGPKLYGMGINEYFKNVVINGSVPNWDTEFYYQRGRGDGDYLLPSPFDSVQLSATYKPTNPIRRVDLYLATITEHFNNPFTLPQADGKWGRLRGTSIDFGAKASDREPVLLLNRETFLNLYFNTGSCIPSGSTDTGGGEDKRDDKRDGVDDVDDRVYFSDPNFPFDEFPKMSGFPILAMDCHGNEVSFPIEQKGNYKSEYPIQGASTTLSPADISYPTEVDSTDLTFVKHNFQSELITDGIRDPREPNPTSKDLQKGILNIVYNCNTCDAEAVPKFRDKDGDIPEFVGPIVENYIQQIRYNIHNVFGIRGYGKQLLELGCGTDGLTQFSDGHSFIEYIGESAFGCGDKISIISVPEFFVEMYRKFENSETKKYRREIERASKLPDWWADILGNIISDVDIRIHDQAHINDLIQDLTLGVPDQDYVEGKTVTYDNWIRWEDWHISYPDDDWSERNDRKLVSRWKAMTRPIFQRLMNSTEVMPRWDSIETLGDFMKYRNNEFGKGGSEDSSPPFLIKNIYDRLDEAISVKNTNELVNSIENQNKEAFNPFYWAPTFITNFFTNVINLPGTDIQVAIPNLPNVRDISNTMRAIERYIKFKPTPQEPEFKLTDTQYNAIIALATRITIDALEYVYLNTVMDLYAPNPPRNSLQPLRMFKEGGVVLQSRTGLYRTMMEPCPVMFLGFQDEMQINADIRTLKKNNLIDTLYYKGKNYGVSVSSDDTENTTLKTIINQNSDNIFNGQSSLIHRSTINTQSINSVNQDGNDLSSSDTLTRIFTRPMMKRRVKKYGINPLLDIFYLNMKPNKSSDAGHPYSHPHPHNKKTPFGYPHNKSDKKIWPDFTWGQYPSIFPPMWNEPTRTTDLNGLAENDLYAGSTHGDIAWKKREPNTILSLYDRWEAELASSGIPDELSEYLKTGNSNAEVLVLRDKTPILDLYYMLMEMHIRGVSWNEILHYVEKIKSCIKYKENDDYELDLSELESINAMVSETLLAITLFPNNDDIYIPPFVLFGMVKDVSTLPETIEDEREVQKLLGKYVKNIHIINRTDKILKIDEIFLEKTARTDIYQNSGYDHFYLNTEQIPNQSDPLIKITGKSMSGFTVNPLDINNSYEYSSMPKIPITFFPEYAEHGFLYDVYLIIRGKLGNNYFYKKIYISGMPTSKYRFRNTEISSIQPLDCKQELYFGDIAAENENFEFDGQTFYDTRDPSKLLIKSLKLTNILDYDDILIESIDFIYPQRSHDRDVDGFNKLTRMIGPKYFEDYGGSSSPVPYFKYVTIKDGEFSVIENNKIILNQILKPFKEYDFTESPVYNLNIAFTPKFYDQVYTANLIINYKILSEKGGVKKRLDDTSKIVSIALNGCSFTPGFIPKYKL